MSTLIENLQEQLGEGTMLAKGGPGSGRHKEDGDKAGHNAKIPTGAALEAHLNETNSGKTGGKVSLRGDASQKTPSQVAERVTGFAARATTAALNAHDEYHSSGGGKAADAGAGAASNDIVGKMGRIQFIPSAT